MAIMDHGIMATPPPPPPHTPHPGLGLAGAAWARACAAWAYAALGGWGALPRRSVLGTRHTAHGTLALAPWAVPRAAPDSGQKSHGLGPKPVWYRLV
jgi:hypothetical protein